MHSDRGSCEGVNIIFNLEIWKKIQKDSQKYNGYLAYLRRWKLFALVSVLWKDVESAQSRWISTVLLYAAPLYIGAIGIT